MIFVGPPGSNGDGGEKYLIPAGQTVDLPDHVWDRYKDRNDIKSMDGTKISIGGMSDDQRTTLPTEAQLALLSTQRAELEKERAAFAAEQEKIVHDLAKREADVESARVALETERTALREERANVKAGQTLENSKR
jgi:hypothetical protein